MKLTASVFEGKGREGDFVWMLEQEQWNDTLFIFNDNVSQSSMFLQQFATGTVDRSSGACTAGAGNGAIRPAQCASPPRAVGIPTGPGFTGLTEHARQCIDAALACVQQFIEAGRYTGIVYSARADDPAVLGHGTFDVPGDVLRYIPAELRRLVDAANEPTDR